MGYSLSGDRFEYRHRRRFGETARVGRLLLCIGSMLGFGLVGHGTASAQVKYTTDDVMARVVEIDRRLVRVETEVENLKSQIREVKADLLAQMDGMKADLLGQIQGNTTTTWALFGAMITLYIAIFVVVLAIYRNV